MKFIRILALLPLMLMVVSCLGPSVFLVENGQPHAEIVIAPDSPRMTALAAHDLQLYLAKISGATLPIVNEPTAAHPLKIYVGESEQTRALGITNHGLEAGAYRLVSGDTWLALIGQDDDFTPIEPWPRSNTDWQSGRVQKAWDAITGAQWGVPVPRLYKHFTGNAAVLDKPRDPDAPIEFWTHDEKGSYNAVCGFLRSLGVRWYMPGEVGEVVPGNATIPLPEVDEIVRPDFAVRRFNFRYRVQPRDVALWASRLGVRDPYDLQVAHGLSTMTHRNDFLAAHPDYFSLYNGKRNNQPDQHYNHPCLSSEAFVQETARYVRAVHDHYHIETVSVMPYDAFTSMCQCDLCKGKDTPERGLRGKLSDYVWDFVNRVAAEVAKTHPDVHVLCCAYGTYREPPLHIAKLLPNVRVCIVGGRYPYQTDPETRAAIAKLRQGWLALTDNPIMIFENYPFTGRGWFAASYVPHTIASSINATKGISAGEDIWLTLSQDLESPGFNAFQIYFTARMYWGGKEQDIDAMLDEYYHLFYGPAEDPMRHFYEYAEAYWTEMNQNAELIHQLFAHLDAARQSVVPESVYARRIALVADYLEPLRHKGELLARPRGKVPDQRLARDAQGIVIDGKLNDAFWEKIPYYANGRLRESQTGREPMFGTRFKIAWGRDNLYIAVHCRDKAGQLPTSGTDKNDDPAIWQGDAIDILLETEQHAYYQITVNPAGAVADLDRQDSGKQQWQWDAQAEVATEAGDGYWNAEIRIPVAEDSNDPFHEVVGRKPLSSLAWHFNICRQRVRPNGTEYSAFSPTGAPDFLAPTEFAKLYEK